MEFMEKFVGFRNRISARKRFGPTPSNIASFFGCIVLYNKNNPHQI
jgi:hypothetical protein